METKLSDQLVGFLNDSICPKEEGVRALENTKKRWIIDVEEQRAILLIVETLRDCDL